MSLPPMPDVTVPDGTSRFNTPAGAGFVQWFATLKATINVLAVEILNRAQSAAEVTANAAITAKDLIGGRDPRAPRIGELTGYLAATASPSGKLLHGVRTDGSVELPVARIGGAVVVEEESDLYTDVIISPSRKILFAVRKDGMVEIGEAATGGTAPVAGASDPYDVVLVSGQSNSTMFDALPTPIHDVDPRLFRWNPASNSIEPLPAIHTYLGSGFAREYVRRMPPGRKVLLVDAGVGSTGFTSTSINPPPAGYTYRPEGTWDRTLAADPINLYTIMVNRIKAAMVAAGANARLVAMLWVQGENDTQTGTALTKEAYAAKFDDLVAGTRAAVNLPNLPVIVGSMTPQFFLEYANGTTLREQVWFAHMDTPRRLQSSAYVYGPENMERHNDTIHFTAQGAEARGPLLVDALTRARLNTPTVKPLPPQNLRASRSGTTVTAKWDHPPARTTAFTIEYSIDGGAWTPITLVVPVALGGTFTAPAGSAVRLRGRSTNEVGTTHNSREVAI